MSNWAEASENHAENGIKWETGCVACVYMHTYSRRVS